jgi:hypothetical protein
MMAQTSCALEKGTRALGTCELGCTCKPGRLFFMLEPHGPQETTGHAMAAPEPSRYGGRIQSCGTRGALEPYAVGSQDPKLYDTRRTEALPCR